MKKILFTLFVLCAGFNSVAFAEVDPQMKITLPLPEEIKQKVQAKGFSDIQAHLLANCIPRERVEFCYNDIQRFIHTLCASILEAEFYSKVTDVQWSQMKDGYKLMVELLFASYPEVESELKDVLDNIQEYAKKDRLTDGEFSKVQRYARMAFASCMLGLQKEMLKSFSFKYMTQDPIQYMLTIQS